MDRLVRLSALWDRLPVFRAVAETERVHRAAERLDTSPSAISRTVRLLEEEVGAPLFLRVGRTLKLTELGRELLDATRSAMRLVDGAVARATPDATGGAIRIGTTSLEARLVASLAIGRTLSEKTAIVPIVTSIAPTDACSALLRGDLDVAITASVGSSEASRRSIEVARVGSVARGVFCGKHHPLARKKAPALDDLVKNHRFAAPSGSRWTDGWPPDVRREVAAMVEDVELAIALVTNTTMLVALPERLVVELGAPLERLAIDALPATVLFVLHRARVSDGPSREERFLADVRAIMQGPGLTP